MWVCYSGRQRRYSGEAPPLQHCLSWSASIAAWSACSALYLTSSRWSETTLEGEAAAVGQCCFMLKLGADSAVSLTSRKRSPQWRGARTTMPSWSQHCWSWLPGERLKACIAARRDCKCSSDLFCCPCSSVKAHTHHCGIWFAHCSAASNSDACCCPGSRVSYTYALQVQAE